MKAYEITVDRAERYIVLAVNPEKAIKKAVKRREKDYPEMVHVVTALNELCGTVLP